MRASGTRVILALVAFGAMTARGAEDPEFARRLLLELDTIEDRAQAGLKTRYENVKTDLLSAAESGVSAVDLYLRATQAREFEGKKRDALEFLAWKKENEDKHKSREFREAARLHAQWLVVTIRYWRGETMTNLANDIRRHVGDVHALNDSIKEGEKPDLSLLREGVRGSRMVVYLGIEKLFADKPTNAVEWVDVPGDVEGIMRSTLLPIYRAEKDKRLLAYWDDRIARAERRGDRIRLVAKQEEVFSGQVPDMKWERTKDLELLGFQRASIQERFNLVKAHPQHPKFEKWLGDLRKELQQFRPTTEAAEEPPVPVTTAGRPSNGTSRAAGYFGTPVTPAVMPSPGSGSPTPNRAPAEATAAAPTPPPPVPAPTPPPAPAPTPAPATKRPLDGQEAELHGEGA